MTGTAVLYGTYPNRAAAERAAADLIASMTEDGCENVEVFLSINDDTTWSVFDATVIDF